MEWILITLAAGLLLIILEVFIPSGGVLGIIAAILFVVSVALGYMHSSLTGSVLLLTLAILVPIVSAIAVHYWPRTPAGKHFFPNHPTEEELNPSVPHQNRVNELLEAEGIAVTPLRPSGVCVFNDVRVDTITEGMMLEPGDNVRVIRIHGTQVVVRKIENTPQEFDSSTDKTEPNFDLPPPEQEHP